MKLSPRLALLRHYSNLYAVSGQTGTLTSSHAQPEGITPTIQYIPIEYVERLEKYVPGGYHPVHLGDRLNNGRYTIVHKLGSGGYSTVWLAHDEHESRYVTVKIVMAAVRDPSRERDIRWKLTKAAAHGQAGGKYVQLLLDEFIEQGPNGNHLCLVSTPGGCSLQESQEISSSSWLFPLDVARAIAAQLILGTAFLHSQNIAHGGKSSPN